MRVIVEGPDGAGKTTLVGELKQHLELEIMPRHADSLRGPQADLARWVADDLRKEPPLDRLYDRHPLISEPIYGPVLRRALQPGFNGGWLATTWSAFKDTNPLVVFCLPASETVIANVEKPEIEQLAGAVRTIRTVYWLYHAQLWRMRAEGWWTMRYDYTRIGELDFLLRLLQVAKKEEE